MLSKEPMNDFVKLRAENTSELLSHFELDTEMEINTKVEPYKVILELQKNSDYMDAIRLLAHGLPKREAVWWACLAARQVQTPETDQDNIDALIAAESWVKKPTDENREKVATLSEKTKHKTAASWAATAALWCTGSIAPADEPFVAPPEYLYAHAVAGCIILAASQGSPKAPEQLLEQFLARGINLAQGGNGQLA